MPYETSVSLRCPGCGVGQTLFYLYDESNWDEAREGWRVDLNPSMVEFLRDHMQSCPGIDYGADLFEREVGVPYTVTYLTDSAVGLL